MGKHGADPIPLDPIPLTESRFKTAMQHDDFSLRDSFNARYILDMYVFLQFSYQVLKEGSNELLSMSAPEENYAMRFAIEEPIVKKLDTIVAHCLSDDSKRLINMTEESVFRNFKAMNDRFAEGDCKLKDVMEEFKKLVVFAEKNMVNNFRNDPKFVEHVDRIIEQVENKKTNDNTKDYDGPCVVM